MNQRDRKLGMGRNITRRDFINGVAATAAGGALSPTSILASGETLPTYPPALTGLRGSHDGSWEVAHRLREDNPWRSVGADADTGESFDLVVVGGGLSGLAAAHFFRVSHGPNARILILDNHDDFGGHAKKKRVPIGQAIFDRIRREPIVGHALEFQPRSLRPSKRTRCGT